jgi:cytochrome P450
MLQLWCSTTESHGFTSTTDDARTLALHVLAYAAFHKSYPFKSMANAEVQNTNPSTYRDWISIILENALIIMVLPESAFSPSFMPLKWQRIGWAIKNFREYMLKQIEDERNLMQSGKQGTGDLVSNLVRASDNAENDADSDDMLKSPLSKAEILGNIFVFNFAGHDTTAISLGYVLLLLVAHHDVQDWVHEELQHYIGKEDPKTLSYSDLFPKLKRCLAVLVCIATPLYPEAYSLCH